MADTKGQQSKEAKSEPKFLASLPIPTSTLMMQKEEEESAGAGGAGGGERVTKNAPVKVEVEPEETTTCTNTAGGMLAERESEAEREKDAAARKRKKKKKGTPIGLAKVLEGYEIMKKVGEGTSGVVYVVQEKQHQEGDGDGDGDGDGEANALSKKKKKKKDKDNKGCCFAIKAYKTASRRGVCTAAIREIGLLRELRHPNVIQMRQVHIAQKERAVFLSYEYINHDLQHVIRHHLSQHKSISEYTVKSLLWQVLRGVDYLHSNWVMHRDLKPSNILIMSEGDQQGVAKIADFGLARIFKNTLQPLTVDGVVVTLWYRAPELLLGAQHYTPAIDVWAVGCLFGELLRLRPLFYSHQLAGNKFQVNQMERIINILGQPSVARWPGLAETTHWKNNTDGIRGYKPSKGKARKLENMLSLKKDCAAIKLLKKMLEYDPKKRISASDALKHEYFHTKPYPGSNCFVDQVGMDKSNLEVVL